MGGRGADGQTSLVHVSEVSTVELDAGGPHPSFCADVRVAEVGTGQVGVTEVDLAVVIAFNVHIQVTQVGVTEVGVFEREEGVRVIPLAEGIHRLDL